MAGSVSGGDKMGAALDKIAKKIGNQTTLNVGFLAGSNYPDGTPVAHIAMINEFGGTVNVPATTKTIYRKVKADGSFAKGGRFVKRAQSNFATDHEVAAHTITIPPRPFFRTMIKTESPHWASDLANILKANGYDADNALNQMGEEIKGELQESIRDWSTPPNAPSTVAKKGFNDPLVDSGTMLNNVDSEVE